MSDLRERIVQALFDMDVQRGMWRENEHGRLSRELQGLSREALIQTLKERIYYKYADEQVLPLIRAERGAALEKAATGLVRDHGGCVDEATLRGTVAWLRARAEEERRG